MRDASGCFCYNLAMKKQSIPARKTPDLSRLDTAQLLLLVGEMQQQIDVLSQLNGKQSQDLGAAHQELREANKRILLLEEAIRLYKARKFAAKRKKSTFQMSLFDEGREDTEVLEREKRRQRAILTIQKKYGKNALLKGMNLEEGATARDRNGQIGGHKA